MATTADPACEISFNVHDATAPVLRLAGGSNGCLRMWPSRRPIEHTRRELIPGRTLAPFMKSSATPEVREKTSPIRSQEASFTNSSRPFVGAEKDWQAGHHGLVWK